MKKDAEALKNLAAREDVDVLCIQEHKLQEKHVEELEGQVLGTLEGWGICWSCSTAKAGYSGVAILYRKASFPEEPTFTQGINADEHDSEGRVLTMKLPSLSIVNVYVPNSGEIPSNTRVDRNCTHVNLLVALHGGGVEDMLVCVLTASFHARVHALGEPVSA
jgi:exonuclease III